MKANKDLRNLMFSLDVSQWEVAKSLGISAPWLSTKLRTELNDKDRTEITKAIWFIALNRKGN